MRMIKCDRCGDVNESGDEIGVYKNSNALSDCMLEMDLCKSCQEKLWAFFKPIPQAAKEDS